MRRRPALWAALAGATALVLAAGAATSGGPGGHERAAPARALPAPVAPAFTPGAPVALPAQRHVSRWAAVRRPAAAHAAPATSAAVVARLALRTPEGTANPVAVIGRRTGADGRPWVRVRLAILPNGSTGWVPRSALGGYNAVRTRLVVDLGSLEATLTRRGRPVLRVPVAVGAPGWDTPTGRFYVRNRLSRYRSPAYGPVAFGTSARSPAATGWPAGGFVGIHGTDRPDLVPGRVSHGCIRMRNADIRALARRMPVGTPLVIR
jgi:lipoprotein-anchoring transpeptidase ErfK/SrfK